MIEGVKSLGLANTFITRFAGDEGIQHMKLQKLAYYCHAWWLSHYPKPFLTKRPEVWRYGPVFPDMYQSLKPFGSNPIRTPQKDGPFGEIPTAGGPFLDGLIDWIWNNYGQYSAIQLSDKTHARGTPWQIIAERSEFYVPAHTEINDEIIKECFSGDVATVLAKQ